jgi:hypothetical protein
MDPPVVYALLMHRKDYILQHKQEIPRVFQDSRCLLWLVYGSKRKQHDQVYQQWRTKLKKGRGPTTDVFISEVRNN